MYIYGNTQSAFTTELLHGCLRNLVGMKFSLPAHVFRLLTDPPWGGSKAGQEGVKESFKDKRLYLECCHSGSGFGQIFQGWIHGSAKKVEEELLL